MLLSLLIATASASNFTALYADSEWQSVSVSKGKDVGEVDISVKVIDGLPCVRGRFHVDVPAKTLLDVVLDIPAAPTFSSETLIASQRLSQHGAVTEYYQHLDVPSWTLAADRFWVLRGEQHHQDAEHSFQWDVFDWRTAHPDLALSLDTEHPDAVEVRPNYGAWKFTQGTGVTVGEYLLCSDPGGNLPEWVQKAAATKTLPNTVNDVVHEAKRRGIR